MEWKQCQTLFFGAPKSLQMVITAMKLKDAYSLEGKLWPTCLPAKSLQSCPTLWPHRRQPTRLLCPWDSPDRNTGVGCHSWLSAMYANLFCKLISLLVIWQTKSVPSGTWQQNQWPRAHKATGKGQKIPLEKNNKLCKQQQFLLRTPLDCILCNSTARQRAPLPNSHFSRV